MYHTNMSITRSKTKTIREAPGLHMLADASERIEKLERATKMKSHMTSMTYDYAMPYDNAGADRIVEYIELLEDIVFGVSCSFE